MAKAGTRMSRKSMASTQSVLKGVAERTQALASGDCVKNVVGICRYTSMPLPMSGLGYRRYGKGTILESGRLSHSVLDVVFAIMTKALLFSYRPLNRSRPTGGATVPPLAAGLGCGNRRIPRPAGHADDLTRQPRLLRTILAASTNLTLIRRFNMHGTSAIRPSACHSSRPANAAMGLDERPCQRFLTGMLMCWNITISRISADLGRNS